MIKTPPGPKRITPQDVGKDVLYKLDSYDDTDNYRIVSVSPSGDHAKISKHVFFSMHIRTDDPGIQEVIPRSIDKVTLTLGLGIVLIHILIAWPIYKFAINL